MINCSLICVPSSIRPLSVLVVGRSEQRHVFHAQKLGIPNLSTLRSQMMDGQLTTGGTIKGAKRKRGQGTTGTRKPRNKVEPGDSNEAPHRSQKKIKMASTTIASGYADQIVSITSRRAGGRYGVQMVTVECRCRIQDGYYIIKLQLSSFKFTQTAVPLLYTLGKERIIRRESPY